jgi:hypothetical protein
LASHTDVNRDRLVRGFLVQISKERSRRRSASTDQGLQVEGASCSAPTASSRPEDNAGTAKASETSGTKPSDRNLFTTEDGQKIAAVGTAQRLNMPTFAVAPVSDGALSANSAFVGVWSSKRGWNGKGRYAMVIITGVSATGLAQGYYVWGPPVKGSWTQDASGYKWFSEYIVNDKFSIKTTPETAAKLEKNVLSLSTFKSDKPSEKSSIELRPIWQLARVRENVEPSAKREQATRQQASRPEAPKREAPAEANPPRNVSGSTMEDRYRACRKLVKGFAQREACARGGSI